MKNLLANWFRNILAFDNGLIKQEFSIVDPTAASADGGLNTVVLAIDPSDGNAPTIVSLYFDGSGVKLFEKKYQDDATAQAEMSAMATDLNEAATLSKEGKIEEAKKLAESLFDKYKRSSDVLNNVQPTMTMTQSNLQYKGFQLTQEGSGEWNGILTDRIAVRADSVSSVKAKIDKMFHKAAGKTLKKEAGITMQNLFFDSVDEAMEFQEKTKSLQGPEGSEEGKPLWEQMGNTDEQVAPSNESTGPEEDNELAPPSLSFDRIEKDKAKSDKDIGKRIKDQVKTEVESALEQKSASVFGPDQEELVKALQANGRNWDEIKKIFVKDLSYNEDDVAVFLDGMRAKEEGGMLEGLPLPPKPPEDLVSPETHDKLVKEVTDKSEPMPEPKPLADEIARADNAEIRKVADAPRPPQTKEKCKKCGVGLDRDEAVKGLCEDCEYVGKNSNLNKVALNPLQEPPAVGQTPGQPLSSPVEEAPTFDAPVPESQTSAPEPEFLEAPKEGDRVYIMGDYETGEDGYEGTMVSEYTTKGDQYAVIAKDDGDNEEVALHRVVKASQKKVAKAYYEKKAHEHFRCSDTSGTEHAGPIVKHQHGTGYTNYCDKHLPSHIKYNKPEPKKEAGYGTDYSGYTNRSTWGLSLWLDNDQQMYDKSRKLAAGARDVDELASMLMHRYSHVLEEKQEKDMNSKEVNWNEIAQNLLNEHKENVEYEHSKSAPGVIEQLPTMDVEKEKDTLLDQLAKEIDPERKKSLEQKYKRLSMASVDPLLQSLHESALKIKAELIKLADEGEGSLVAIYNLDKMVTSFNESTQDWSGETQDFGFIDKGHIKVNSMEEALAKVKEIYGMDFEPVPDAPGRFEANQTENAEGMEDPNGKYLSDYSVYIKLYKEQSTGPLRAASKKAELEREGEVAIYFHKEGVEKKAANDSAFESNGWCRVWIQDSEIESHAAYPQILKLPNENARIAALKELAKELAHEALRSADESAGKVGVQAWFESLNPSDHDRIDWVALANPVSEEEADQKFEDEMGRKYGPESVHPDFRTPENQSSQDPKLEKKAADPVPAPEVPVTYKEVERAPKHTDRSKAVPATQEQAEVAKNLQISMSSIESIKDLVKRVKADLDKRILAIQQAGGLAQLEEGKKKEVDQLAALIDATESKLISYGEHLYGYSKQTETVGPKLSDAWRVEKLVEKFSGAAEYLKAAEAGAQNMAKEVTTKTLTKFPKLSRLDKQAGFLDSLSDVYNDVLEALKLIIGNEPKEEPTVV